jgi:succinate-semialdehyde dehydrogenase / glutarate-semialdehyde dehydrogenase
VVTCFADAGLPPGALNLVIGPRDEVGEELVANPISRAVKITASTATGRRVMELAARHIKRLTLELGGQTPLIVLPDADVDRVVPAAVRRTYSNMGQVCIGVNRILVDRSIAADFVDAFAEHARALRVGHGLDPDIDYGPLFDAPTRERTERHVEDARGHGATVVVGGRRPAGERFARGFFYEPTLVTDATPDMLVMREETFGPVAAVATVRSDDEAVELANASTYGLAAYVFGADLERCLRIATRLEAGGVGVNINDVTELHAPFGGWKESGLGRELGPEGLESCLELKHIRIGSGG